MKLPSLFPHDEKFCDFLEKQAEHALISAQQLKIFVENPDKQPASAEIDKVRAEAKTLVSQLTLQLCRSFITPFDREDIQDFSDIMYKIPKMIQHIKERIVMHEIPISENGVQQQADLILQEAAEMQKLVKALISKKGSKGVIKYINRLIELEHKGDHIRNEMLVALYKSDRDIRDILLRRDIYDMLEKVVDRFREAAGVALQIVLKHS